MMGPIDPFQYRPTPQLVALVLFGIFPLIYICGRLVTYILWQIFRCMKFCLLGLYQFLYADDFEESQQIEKEIRRRKSEKKRKKFISLLSELSESAHAHEKSNGNSVAAPAGQNGNIVQKSLLSNVHQQAVEEPAAVEVLQVETVERSETPMSSHSPTDDDDDNNSKDSQTDSMEDCKLRHRHVDLTNYPKELDLDPLTTSTEIR